MSPDDDFWVAVHEGGHALVASLLGHQPVTATVIPGEKWMGCALYLPRPVPQIDGFDRLNPPPFQLWPPGAAITWCSSLTRRPRYTGSSH